MKKLNIINIFLIILVYSVFNMPVNAATFIDLNGTYTDLDREGSVQGGGISFLWDMPDYFNSDNLLFYINSTFTYSQKDKNKPAEIVRTYIPVSAGIEFRYQFFSIPLYTTASAGAGMSYFEKQGPSYYGYYTDPSKTRIDSARGPYADFMLGLNYVLSQRISVFVKGGYQLSKFNDDTIESPSGMQFSTGLRIAVTGSNRTFDENDETWYAPVRKKIMVKPETKRNTHMEFTPGIIIPLGNFGDMAEPGYGGMVNLTQRNLFFKRFEAGIGTGLYYAPGKDLTETKKMIFHRFLIAPLLINTGYRIQVVNSLSLTPGVSFGITYLNFSYKYYDSTSLKETETKKNTVDRTVKSGLRIEYNITNSISLSAAGEYGMFIEKSGSMKFAASDIGFNYKF